MRIAFQPTKRSRINRRGFLRGAGGIAIGLPFLEGLPSRSAWAQTDEPIFSFFLCQSCGVVGNSFWPEAAGPLTTSGLAGSDRAVAALADYADYLLMVGGIRFPGNNNGCGHAQGLCQVLTGAASNGAGGNSAQSTAPSVDTLIANALNPSGVAPLAMYAGLKGGYINERLSFVSAGQVRPMEGNPYEIFKDLITQAPADNGQQPADPVEAEEMVDEVALRQNSVNDLVRDQISALKANSMMSRADQDRLDRHLEGIRDLEEKMGNSGLVASLECTQGALEQSRFQAVDGKSRQNGMQEELAMLHVELAAFAFACNLNRTGALQVGDGTDATVYDVPSNSRRWGMHYVSHRTQSDGAVGNDATAEQAHREIDILRLQNYKKGIDAFASYSTANGNLLNNSVFLWTNHVSDGPSHSFANVPTIIAGSGGGFLKQGEFVQLGNGNTGGFGGGGGGVTNDRLLNTIKTAVGVPSADMIDEIIA